MNIGRQLLRLAFLALLCAPVVARDYLVIVLPDRIVVIDLGGDGTGGIEATHVPFVVLHTATGAVILIPLGWPPTLQHHSAVTVPFHAEEMK